MMSSQEVPFALLYIRANGFEHPEGPEFPFMVMYRTMNGNTLFEFLRTRYS
jgi:hypothetical protein